MNGITINLNDTDPDFWRGCPGSSDGTKENLHPQVFVQILRHLFTGRVHIRLHNLSVGRVVAAHLR